MKLTTNILFGLILFAGGLLLSRVVLSNVYAVDGITLGNLNQKLAAVEKENMMLKEKLYQQSAYSQIASGAATLGFAEQKAQVSVNNATSLALK